MDTKKLFPEFPPVTTQEWEETINKDLKGADYDKKLVWNTIEGFKVKPYYRSEDLDSLSYLNVNPDAFPFVRGSKKDNNNWDIRQDIDTENVKEANRIALDAVAKGANAIGFSAKSANCAEDIKALVNGLDLIQVKIHFIGGKSYLQILRWFLDVLKEQGIDSKLVAGSFNFDPFAYVLKHGEFWGSEDVNYEEAVAIIKLVNDQLPKFRAMTINGNLFHNAGSSLVQELAFALAEANEYTANLTDRGLKPEEATTNMVFSFAVGGNYFMEIAKLRAARLLWAKIVEQYKPMCTCAYNMFIHTTTSMWNKSIYDPYVNMLRTTTESMSAAIAGADSISVLPFDASYKQADDFSNRIARNQQILLKEESYLGKIVDPAAGSYYIENLTNSIAAHAWELFKQIEAKGGFAAAIKSGFIQAEIEKTAQQRDMEIATRKTTVLGTNQYPNLLENMASKIEPKAKGSEVTGIKTLRIYRGSEAFEELRLAVEKSAKRPKVFLLTYGNLAMRKARAGFATNFFGVAGYELIDNPGFKTAEEGIQAALTSKADVVVLCSSDEEYTDLVNPVCQALKGKVKNITLAGYPTEQIEAFKAAGVNEFIHVKTNVLESLKAYHKILGIA